MEVGYWKWQKLAGEIAGTCPRYAGRIQINLEGRRMSLVGSRRPRCPFGLLVYLVLTFSVMAF